MHIVHLITSDDYLEDVVSSWSQGSYSLTHSYGHYCRYKVDEDTHTIIYGWDTNYEQIVDLFCGITIDAVELHDEVHEGSLMYLMSHLRGFVNADYVPKKNALVVITNSEITTDLGWDLKLGVDALGSDKLIYQFVSYFLK